MLRDYTLVKLVAEGGMGAVFEARGPTGRRVAVKILKPEFSRDEEMRSKFLSEIAKLSRMRHQSGIVELLDEVSDRTGRLAMVMEYLDGVTLRTRLSNSHARRMPPAIVLRYGVQIAQALAAMFKSGLAHGDLKPENLMVTTEASGQECVKIIDLGIAGWLIPTGLTRREAELWGSGFYQAPEVLRTRRPTPEADVFALGQILYECLTGSIEEGGGLLPAEVPPRLRALIGTMRQERVADRPSICFVMQEFLQILKDKYPKELPLLSSIVDLSQDSGRITYAGHVLPAYDNLQRQSVRPRHQQRVIFGAGIAACLSLGLFFLSHYLLDAGLAELLPLPRTDWPVSGATAGPQADQKYTAAPSSSAQLSMSLVQADVFQMGSSGDEVEQALQSCQTEVCADKARCAQVNLLCKKETFAREMPKHRVLIDHDFLIDNNLVTKGEWAHFLNNLSPRLHVEPDRDTGVPRFVYLYAEKFLIHDLHPAGSDLLYEGGHFSVKSGRESSPADQVTWIGALFYCRFAGKQLLSEAIWEYVKTNPKLAERNPLLHMSPGLGEWMVDSHRQCYPNDSEPFLESGQAKVDIDPASYHIVRGCSAADLRIFCRPTARGFQLASNAPLGVGFRCMMPLRERR